jgi:hypothetical protein
MGYAPKDLGAVIWAWQEAASDEGAIRLVVLSGPNSKVVRPRVSSGGSQVLPDWLERTGLTVTTHPVFACGPVVVVVQRGVQRSLRIINVTGDPTLASSFRFQYGRVKRFARIDDLSPH